MAFQKIPSLILSCCLASLGLVQANAAISPYSVVPQGKPQKVAFQGEEVTVDGNPVQIRGAEMHPQRIPREYWRHRVQMAKAMGLNTVSIYIMWNGLERADGSFDVKTGSRDIAAFMKICAEEKMWVLFRPGPYVCAEWDFGGLPIRMLADPKLEIRTVRNERFMKEQTRYLDMIAKLAEPFLAKNGGPILLTQVENEYGSWPKKEISYPLWLRDYWIKKGFEPLYTADGSDGTYFKNGVIPGVAIGLNPGVSETEWQNARNYLAEVRKQDIPEVKKEDWKEVPIMSSETYCGWLRHWGEGNWNPSNKNGVIDWCMKNKKSFVLYMAHGGTNFGFTAGANDQRKQPDTYTPSITSYDYAAPINEQGLPTGEYHQYRDTMMRYLPAESKPPQIPAQIPSMEVAEFTPKRWSSLWAELPYAVPVTGNMWFETWNQNQGIVVYQTELPAGPAATFHFEHLNDYGQIYLDGKSIGRFDRRANPAKSMPIPAREKPAKLEVLVEGMGHINFGAGMETDRKGLFGKLSLDQTELKNWKISKMPLASATVVGAKANPAPNSHAGAHFRANLVLSSEPQDTFFDMSKYDKGFVWVNGHNLGRYWKVGPQLRLYCPASYLKKGNNVIDVVDLEMTEPRPIRGCKWRNTDMNNINTRNADNVW